VRSWRDSRIWATVKGRRHIWSYYILAPLITQVRAHLCVFLAVVWGFRSILENESERGCRKLSGPREPSSDVLSGMSEFREGVFRGSEFGCWHWVWWFEGSTIC
jgi:hypothetical protein